MRSPQLREPLAGHRRDLERLGIVVGEPLAPSGRDAVDLVDDELDGKLARTDLGEHRLDRGALLGDLRRRAASRRRRAGRDRRRGSPRASRRSPRRAGRQSADEADRVGHEVALALRARTSRVVGSSVSKRRFSTETSAPVKAFRSVDLPTFVYPASATVGVAERLRALRRVARCAADVRGAAAGAA